MQALTSMMNLELPHINILSKLDLMAHLGKTELKLEQYLVPSDLGYIFDNEYKKKSKFD